MTDLDVDMLIVAMDRDAGIIGCARPEQLQSWEHELVRIQDEIARAIEKARRAEKAA